MLGLVGPLLAGTLLAHEDWPCRRGPGNWDGRVVRVTEALNWQYGVAAEGLAEEYGLLPTLPQAAREAEGPLVQELPQEESP